MPSPSRVLRWPIGNAVLDVLVASKQKSTISIWSHQCDSITHQPHSDTKPPTHHPSPLTPNRPTPHVRPITTPQTYNGYPQPRPATTATNPYPNTAVHASQVDAIAMPVAQCALYIIKAANFARRAEGWFTKVYVEQRPLKLCSRTDGGIACYLHCIEPSVAKSPFVCTSRNVCAAWLSTELLDAVSH